MPVTAPAGLQKIKSEFGLKDALSSNTYDSGSGSVTAPAGAEFVRIKVWGGGGGGLWVSSPNTYYGGGGGGFALALVPVVGGTTSVSYSVGSGGTAGSFSATNGGNSTVTVGAVTYTGAGGQAGQLTAGGTGGTGTNGDLTESGDTAPTGIYGYGGNAGGLPYGGGAGGVFTAGSAPGGGGSGWNGNLGSNSGSAGAAGRVTLDWLDLNSSNNLSGFIRGGTYVPNNSLYTDIPTSTTGLAISNFESKSKILLSLPNWAGNGYDMYIWSEIIDNTGSGASAKSVLTVKAGGSIIYTSFYDGCATQIVPSAAFSNINSSWITEGTNSGFYVYLTGTGDSVSGSATDTLLELNTDRQWSLCADAPTNGSDTTVSFAGTLSIRDASNNVLVSKTIQFFAHAFSSSS